MASEVSSGSGGAGAPRPVQATAGMNVLGADLELDHGRGRPECRRSVTRSEPGRANRCSRRRSEPGCVPLSGCSGLSAGGFVTPVLHAGGMGFEQSNRRAAVDRRSCRVRVALPRVRVEGASVPVLKELMRSASEAESRVAAYRSRVAAEYSRRMGKHNAEKTLREVTGKSTRGARTEIETANGLRDLPDTLRAFENGRSPPTTPNHRQNIPASNHQRTGTRRQSEETARGHLRSHRPPARTPTHRRRRRLSVGDPKENAPGLDPHRPRRRHDHPLRTVRPDHRRLDQKRPLHPHRPTMESRRPQPSPLHRTTHRRRPRRPHLPPRRQPKRQWEGEMGRRHPLHQSRLRHHSPTTRQPNPRRRHTPPPRRTQTTRLWGGGRPRHLRRQRPNPSG